MKYSLKSNFKSGNRGAYIALCFFLLFASRTIAETLNDTIIFTQELSIDPSNRTSISENQFSFITADSWNMKKRELKIISANLKTGILSTTTTILPTNIKVLQCPTFCTTDSFLLIQDEYDMNWFLFKNVESKFKFVEQIKLPAKTMAFDARVINEHLFLLTDMYNHHPLDSVFNTSLIVYDASKRKIVAVKHPPVPCIGLSHFPKNWVSQNKSLIALAEPCGNKIQLYDTYLKSIKTISIPDSENWIDLPGNKLPVESSPDKINPKIFIENFKPALSKFSRIETIHFANDSILLIHCNYPDTASFHCKNFVYNARSGKFLSPNSISTARLKTEYSNNQCDLPYQIFPEEQIKNGICILLDENNYITDSKATQEENENQKNIFYQENDPKFIIRISKINIK